MLLAVTALLLQPLAVPQNLIAPVTTLASSADPRAAVVPNAAAPAPEVGGAEVSAVERAESAPAQPLRLPEFNVPGITFGPRLTASAAVLPSAPVTVIVVPVAADLPDSSSLPGAAGVSEFVATPILAVRPRVTDDARLAQQRRMWLALSMAQHGAATFDAWSTRRAITSGAGRETNPMLRPFAGNGSLYAAIQVGPLVLDYVSRRMMTSRHGWVRHTWWLPQTLGTAMSIVSGAHNLSLHAAD